MKRRLNFTLFVAFMAMLGLVGAGTLALFTDQMPARSNVAEAGTVELDITGNGTDARSFEFSNIQPGDDGRMQWRVQNVGSLPGVLTVDLRNISGNRRLANQIRPTFRRAGGSRNFDNHGSLTRPSIRDNGFVHTETLQPGERVFIAIDWVFATGGGYACGDEAFGNTVCNRLQGESTSFDVFFRLVQLQ